MQRSTMPIAVILAALLGLSLAAPAGAATTGTICGQVTAFTAPTVDGDGEITIDGTTEVIDQSAFTAIDASASALLTALAEVDATTCLDIVANEDGDIVDLALAAEGQICGDVAFDAATGLYTIGGTVITATIVSADAELAALLDAAATGDADVCLDVTVDATTGLITSPSLSGTITVCGDVTLDADSATIGGVDVPLSLLEAEAQAVLAIAVQADAEVCVQLVIDDTSIFEANLSADILVCGEVTFDAEGNAVVDGVTIDADLLSAGAEALLALAASADGEACAAIVAVSSDGDTSVTVSVTIEVCAEVTAIGDGTITLGDVTLAFAGAADSDIEVGDVICVLAATGPTGEPVVTEVVDDDAVPGDDDAAPGDDDDDVTLPDTATRHSTDPFAIGVGLLVAALFSGAALRRFAGRTAR